jgi:protein-S-isoprenylcysteine O-methyltransferase Ste14
VSKSVNVAKTLVQIAIFWSFFLALVPWLLLSLENALGLGRYRFETPATHWIGGALFLAMGAIGFSCGMLFAVFGSGTPLPLDTATKLVILGPYRYVRNPMAITGLVQGIGVGVYYGSPFTILYAVCGIFVWDRLARPWEEADLARRFGEPYVRYRESVRCWIPRLRPYRAPELPESCDSAAST